MDKISIIIPVYNVEAYIRKCLNSVIGQTYKNLEILLVDDGSTDSSGRICDEYAERDGRITVFHTPNGGLSSALNAGLANFTGDYLGFVDPDDWIEPDMFETLYNAVKSENVQISIAGYFKDTDTGSTPMVNMEQIPNGVISVRNMLLYPLKRDYYMGFCGYVWNKLYLGNAVRESGLRFSEEIRYGMDVLFFVGLVLKQCCKGVYVSRPLYHYLQRDSAISKTQSVELKTHILSVYNGVDDLLNKNGYTDISFWARGFYCYHAGVIAGIALKNSDKKTLEMMQLEIERHLDDYAKTNTAFPEKVDGMRKLLEAKVPKDE